MIRSVLVFLLTFIIHGLYAQDTLKRCAAVEVLNKKFEGKPEKRQLFEERRAAFNRKLKSGGGLVQGQSSVLDGTVYTIPVVFHIVLLNPNLVSDEQIYAQLDTLNKDFGGTNGDSTKIPSYFKPLFGKAAIQFCLAQRTPDGHAFTGIDRVVAGKNTFSVNESVKKNSTGGADSWDSRQYYNVWICNLSGGILGYSSFPDDNDPDLQGVVVDYRTLPGGQFTSYNSGKTLTHESGHFFNLYHIWGDDNGSCSGTDFIDDTPNQSNSSSGCTSGPKYDNCTPTGNGVMFQNYMDYTFDDCLLMFTNEQVLRMETTVQTYYRDLASSNACQPVISQTHDAAVTAILQPEQRLCDSIFTPVITIRNLGADTLKTLSIAIRLSNGFSSHYTWNGSLPYYKAAQVPLESMSVDAGNYTLTVTLTAPNNAEDENHSNDSMSFAFQYFSPVQDLTEGFESSQFPLPAWMW
jgi:hypothetical protein